MKRFLCRLFLNSLLAVTVIWTILLILFRINLMEKDHIYLLADTDKQELLDAVQGRRLIIVGGSHATFGLNSHRIADSIPEYTPVNMALHAGLGMNYMLEEIEDKVKSDDVVVIVLDGREFGSVYWGDTALFELLGYRRQYTKFLTIRNFPVSLFNERFRVALTYIYKKMTHANLVDDLYDRMKFDHSTGDYLGQLDLPRNLKQTIQYPETPQVGNMALFRKTLSRMESKGIKVLCLNAPINKGMWGHYFDQFMDNRDILKQHGINILGDVENYFMNDTCFIENEHLRRCGNNQYTEKIIKDLKASMEGVNN